ncbi:pectin lyase fold/virulence factor [Mycena vitilis]|nr:pectin lyase fold/virulence factor [Mycena vitilis]
MKIPSSVRTNEILYAEPGIMPWWDLFQTIPREDGDGRPISLTVFRAVRGVIRNFAIEAQPFWCNCIAESQSVVYDGMRCNASNENPMFAGQKTHDDDVALSRTQMFLYNRDDCVAIKGNSTNVIAKNIVCRGGNGIAFGSLGQYANLTDIVENVFMENLTVQFGQLSPVFSLVIYHSQMTRIAASVQPNMGNGVYFKSWDASINGAPPTGGGAGEGQFRPSWGLSEDSLIVALCRGDLPSMYKFEDLRFENWSGTAVTNELVALECSPAANCTNISFTGFNVSVPAGETPEVVCQNAQGVTGLSDGSIRQS